MNRAHAEVTTPRTLWEAHQAVMATRPSRRAPDHEWHRFRANAADVYSAVAELDRAHRDETMYWANLERARAGRIKEHRKQAAASRDAR